MYLCLYLLIVATMKCVSFKRLWLVSKVWVFFFNGVSALLTNTAICAGTAGAKNLKARFENMAKAEEEEARKKAEEERARRETREKKEQEEQRKKQQVGFVFIHLF